MRYLYSPEFPAPSPIIPTWQTADLQHRPLCLKYTVNRYWAARVYHIIYLSEFGLDKCAGRRKLRSGKSPYTNSPRNAVGKHNRRLPSSIGAEDGRRLGQLFGYRRRTSRPLRRISAPNQPIYSSFSSESSSLISAAMASGTSKTEASISTLCSTLSKVISTAP